MVEDEFFFDYDIESNTYSMKIEGEVDLGVYEEVVKRLIESSSKDVPLTVTNPDGSKSRIGTARVSGDGRLEARLDSTPRFFDKDPWMYGLSVEPTHFPIPEPPQRIEVIRKDGTTE